jgi:hypothetical protein
VRTPHLPQRRSLAGLLLTALVAATLGTGPASAADATEAPTVGPERSLRAALASGRTALTELPRGEMERTPARPAALRSTAQAAAAPAPVRAALTATRVSTIDIRFVDTPGNRWSPRARAAFRAAADVWERSIESRVPIVIEATARNLGSGLLGGAGPYDFLRNEGRTVVPAGRTGTAAELRDDVFEPVALFNARTGRDALPARDGNLHPDIVAEFNPNADGLYLGTDGRPGPTQIDFRTVVLHEIGHGLGITGTAGLEDGRATVGDTEINGRTGVRSGVSFDQFTYATTPAQAGTGGTRVLSMPNGSAALRAALVGGQLFWAGQQALTAAGGAKVRLHAPSQCGEQGPLHACARGESPFVEGSSYSHLDEQRYPRNSPQGLMTPYLQEGEAYLAPGQITLGLLADMGYAVPALKGTRYTAAEPARVLDTRRGLGAPAAAVGPGGTVDLRLGGVAGVPAAATAVVLNVTAVAPTADTDVRVYPTPVTASPVPVVSNLNLERAATRANLVTVALGEAGRVRLRNSAGSIHLVADLAGWYAPAGAASFRAVDPVRVLDTRRAVGRAGSTPVGAGGVVPLALAGTRGIPAGATAVAITVTAVAPTERTDVRVYPGGGDPAAVPRISSLNAAGDAPVANLVVVRLGPDGTVRLRNAAGEVHLLADLAGYYADDPGGSLFRAVTPRRVLDTRTRGGARGRLGPGETTTLTVGGSTTIPRSATAAALNVTGVAASALTDIRVYPATAASPPVVSNLNLSPGTTAADAVVVRLGGGQVVLRNSRGSVALAVDAAGWFGPAT